jgi:hypothetical protein
MTSEREKDLQFFSEIMRSRERIVATAVSFAPTRLAITTAAYPPLGGPSQRRRLSDSSRTTIKVAPGCKGRHVGNIDGGFGFYWS